MAKAKLHSAPNSSKGKKGGKKKSGKVLHSKSRQSKCWPAEGFKKKTVKVFGKRMSYVEIGRGDPIVFLHGNPTSSYLWRNVIPSVSHLGRCIAIDLIGMGDSEKLENSGPARYTFEEHFKFLEAALKKLKVKSNVILVLHDWGSGLGFHWANHNQDALKGIVYMEAIVQPFNSGEDPDLSLISAFRSPMGEELVLENNAFVESLLPAGMIRELSDVEFDTYRCPYKEAGEDRRPTLTWPREVPIDGKPENVHAIVQDYADWLSVSQVSKLFINAEPGTLLIGPPREFCRKWPNQVEVTVIGIHFIQEDSPIEIGEAIRSWVESLVFLH